LIPFHLMRMPLSSLIAFISATTNAIPRFDY
jgi:hypothetical protein